MFTLDIRGTSLIIDHVVFRLKKPVMMWGPPGVGKSQCAQQSAVRNNAFLVDIRLGQYDSVDMRGIPAPDAETRQTVWYPPATLPFKGNPNFPTDRPILIIFDEINAATPAVSGTAYQIFEKRGIGEHELMDNVVMVCAGNRESDKGVTNRQPLPLSNRLIHIEVIENSDVWIEDFAIPNKLPAVGIAFIQFRKPLLNTFDPKLNEKAFATPRTWAMALEMYADDIMPMPVKQATVAGCIGDGPAAEFWGFVDVWQNMIPIEDILKDPTGVALPEELSMTYAVAVAVSGAMTPKTTTACYAFLKRLAPEFVVMAWQMAVRRDADLFGVDEFIDFSQEYKAVFQ